MANCDCETGIMSLGQADCLARPSIITKAIFTGYFKDDSSVNGIDLTTPFTGTQFDAKINETNKKIKWSMTAEISLFTTERADPSTVDKDGVSYNLFQGARTLSFEILKASPELVGRLNGTNCFDLGMHLVDVDNNLVGLVTRDNYFDPIKLESNGFSKFRFETNSDTAAVTYNGTWGKYVKDENIRVMPYSEHGIDFSTKRDLIKVSAKDAASVTTTTAKVSFYQENGTVSGVPYTGLVFGDFTAINTTTSLAVAVTGAVESPDGTYTLTYAAQTTNDLGTITATKAGFDFVTSKITFL